MARTAAPKLRAECLSIGQVLVTEEGVHGRVRVLWCRRFRSNCHGSASEVPDSHLKGGSEISISMPFFNPKLRKDGRKMSCWIMRRWFYYVNWLPLHNATANPRMVSELRPGRKFCDRLCFLALCCLATCSEEEGCFVGAVGHCKMFDVVSVRARSAVSKL